MPAPPARTELSDTFPNPSNATMRTGMGKLYDYVTGLLGASGNAADARTALGAVASSGGDLTGALNGNRMTVTAHATDTPIWSDSGSSAGTVATTGTPTITDFPAAPQAGAKRAWYPAAGTVITHGGDMAVQGAANYTFAAGDWAIVEALTTSTFRVTVFKADGTPVVQSLPSQSGNAGKSLVTNGTDAAWGSAVNLGAVANSTSGTAVDFTGIPDWARKIRILLSGVSTTGTSNLRFKLGTSGGIQSTGYACASGLIINSAGSITEAPTDGFGLPNGNATNLFSGIVELSLVDPATDTWAASFVLSIPGAVIAGHGAGVKALSAKLDRVRITTANGTDTFDAGAINISWE